MRISLSRPFSSRGTVVAARVLLALMPAALVPACGGMAKQEDDGVGQLDRAFREPVRSAEVKLDAQLEIEGLKGLERPVRLQASGPYIAGAGGLPRLDLDLKIGAQGAGQSVDTGLLSTGQRVFVKFGGRFYEQRREDVERANRELRKQSGEGSAGTLGELGIDPRRWVIEAREEGGDEVAGVETRHLSGKLDVRATLADFNELVRRSDEALGDLAPGAPRQLSDEDLDHLAKVAQNPSFDVYVARDDDTIRRVSAKLEFELPEAERPRFGGVEGGSLRFSAELGDVNGDQRVEAPAKARPIADLAMQLGGLDALLGGVGGEGPQQGPGVPTTSPGGTGPEAPGETTPDSEALKRYSECLDKTAPDDTAGLTRCADLLR